MIYCDSACKIAMITIQAVLVKYLLAICRLAVLGKALKI